jgi:type IV secretion system protein VirB3
MAGIVIADPLFIGLTRPPMLFGVSYTFAVTNGMLCMLAYIGMSKLIYLAMMFPIHALGYYLCTKEPLFIELFKVRAEKCSRSKNKIYHGANSYDVY